MILKHEKRDASGVVRSNYTEAYCDLCGERGTPRAAIGRFHSPLTGRVDLHPACQAKLSQKVRLLFQLLLSDQCEIVEGKLVSTVPDDVEELIPSVEMPHDAAPPLPD